MDAMSFMPNQAASAEVAQACVQRERVALLRLREEEGDIGHRRGEVAAAEAAQERERQEHEVGVFGSRTA